MAHQQNTEFVYLPGKQHDSTTANLNSKLIHPFRALRPERMNELVDDFMERTKIDPMYRETFQKGAFLAQDSNAFAVERRDGLVLSKVEREWLAVEDVRTGNKWNQPW